MKKIIFEYTKGWNDVEKEEFEFEDDISEEEIQKEFEYWVWSFISDSVTWYEE